jgi:hypothetical protein
MATHLPINHRLRGLYRALAALAALYVLIFGVVGAVRTGGMAAFATHGERVLGLTTNPAFSVLSIVVGGGILVGLLIGRNVDVALNLVLGGVFLLAGLFMLALLRTDLNLLAFSMTDCVVSFVIGLLVLTAGLYGLIGSGRPAPAEEGGEQTAASDRETVHSGS